MTCCRPKFATQMFEGAKLSKICSVFDAGEVLSSGVFSSDYAREASLLHEYKSSSEFLDRSLGSHFAEYCDRYIYAENHYILPCGKCKSCRIRTASEWTARLNFESRYHESACFLTLTYATENLPENFSLYYPDVQGFLKRLRARISPRKIRFFCCGEYGAHSTKRPHYHIILFGYSFPDDRVLHGMSTASTPDNPLPLYTSESLTQLWGKGICILSDFSVSTASYVARYCTKKFDGSAKEREFKQFYGQRTPEFCRMSTSPGIGYSFYDEFKDSMFDRDGVTYVDAKGKIVELPVPRYFNKKYATTHPGKYEFVREKRIHAMYEASFDVSLRELLANNFHASNALEQLPRSYEAL